MGGEPIARVLAIALRCRDKGKMTEVAEAAAEAGGGLVGDIAARADRVGS